MTRTSDRQNLTLSSSSNQVYRRRKRRGAGSAVSRGKASQPRKIKISVNGNNGVNGKRGRNGSGSGKSGGDATQPTAGRSAGEVYIHLEEDSSHGLVRITGHTSTSDGKEKSIKYQFLGNGSPPEIEISANGGNGGAGGIGGNGTTGERGRSGRPATQGVCGTPGGPGGRGGDAGSGTSGADGGAGGRVVIDLYKKGIGYASLFDKYSVKGGEGGERGRHGQAGPGGSGGSGGASCAWVRTTGSGQNMRTESCFTPGGPDGPNGPKGSTPTSRLYDGDNGADGSVKYQITHPNGDVTTHTDRFRVDLSGLKVTSRHSKIIEPRSSASLSLTASNTGGMETPEGRELIIQAKPATKWGMTHQGGKVLPPLNPNEQVRCQDLGLEIFPMQGPAKGKRFKRQVQLNVSVLNTRTNRSLPESTTNCSFIITYPVEITKIDGDTTALPGKPAKVAWKVKNLSDVPLGSQSDCQRQLASHVRFVGGENLTQEQIIFCDESGRELPLGEAIGQSIACLPPGESVEIRGAVAFKDGVAPYNHISLAANLDLGRVADPTVTDNIQERDYDIQLAEYYLNKGNADVLLIVDNTATKEETEAWKAFLAKNNKKVAIWNVDVYGTWSLTKTLKRLDNEETDHQLFKDFKNKSVVILDTSKGSKSMITTKGEMPEFFQAAAEHGMTTYIVGGKASKSRLADYAKPPKSEAGDIFGSVEDFVTAEAGAQPLAAGKIGKITATTTSYFAHDEGDLKAIAEAAAEQLHQRFPERDYRVTYHYNKQTLLQRWLLPNKVSLGEIHISRGVDKTQHIVAQANQHDRAKNKSWITSPQNRYGYIKSLPFNQKLNYLETSGDEMIRPEALAAVISDIAEEQKVLRDQAWLGPMTADDLAERMKRLDELVTVTTSEKLKNVWSHNKVRLFLKAMITELRVMNDDQRSFLDRVWLLRGLRRRYHAHRLMDERIAALETVLHNSFNNAKTQEALFLAACADIAKGADFIRKSKDATTEAERLASSYHLTPKQFQDGNLLTDFNNRG